MKTYNPPLKNSKSKMIEKHKATVKQGIKSSVHMGLSWTLKMKRDNQGE